MGRAAFSGIISPWLPSHVRFLPSSFCEVRIPIGRIPPVALIETVCLIC